jgi:uncharacterized protein (TIGR03083 family)
MKVSGLKPASPVDVRGLFGPDRQGLLSLLEDLSTEEWSRPTICSGWDVRDVALHILGVDLGNLAGRRDGSWHLEPRAGESVGAFINRINQEWVEAGRRISSRLLIEMLTASGAPLFECLEALDPNGIGGSVLWAGPDPAPVWLDVAREYMERWVHQQHIRDAVSRPGQDESEFVAPVVAASMRAVPRTLSNLRADQGHAVAIDITGSGGSGWTVAPDGDEWQLFEGVAVDATTKIAIASDDWWRVVTRGLQPSEAYARARISGDERLAKGVFQVVAILA